ncbi:Hint domain-containing protein [Actibacterium ureilyticum]|uniref:Hint domain-containing protein n=1 Tax=Actibacterium ureilyticum TaxID=1590614 RepID=UPI000BAACBE5|nr:Hint domain-containing protein [Actibacterium ureilyticum]
MPLNPGDLMFIGWDADSEDIAFVTTVPLQPGEVIYFTDDEWTGTSFNGSEQLFEWTVPAAGIPVGTVVTIDMDPVADTVTFDSGGSVDYIQGGYQIATQNEMFWAFQGSRVGDDVTPTNFIGVIANEADGNANQTPNLSGTGLTTSNGAIIIDGDEDYMEYTADAGLPDPITRQALIDSISDTNNWATADGTGNSNPNPGSGFELSFPPVVCFCAETRVQTSQGLRRIGDLAPGDLVDTVDGGPQPVRWVGQRRVLARGALAPVHFSTGTVGNSRPLRVSAQHRILIGGWKAQLLFGEDEILVPACQLINGDTITRIHGGWVTYVHILFDRHQVILAEGAPCESFFPGETGLDAMIDQMRDELMALFPELFVKPHRYSKTARMVISKPSARLLTN